MIARQTKHYWFIVTLNCRMEIAHVKSTPHGNVEGDVQVMDFCAALGALGNSGGQRLSRRNYRMKSFPEGH